MAYKSFAGMDEDENRFLHELPWDPEPWFSVPADNQHPEGLAWAPAEFEDLVAFDPQPVEIEDHRRIVHSVRHKKTPSSNYYYMYLIYIDSEIYKYLIYFIYVLI